MNNANAVLMQQQQSATSEKALRAFNAFERIKAFAVTKMKAAGINPQDYEDCLQDLYLEVYDAIDGWNPRTSKLITYLSPCITSVIFTAKENGSTPYYREMAFYYKKAVSKLGEYASDAEIAKEMSKSCRREVSVKTVKRARNECSRNVNILNEKGEYLPEVQTLTTEITETDGITDEILKKAIRLSMPKEKRGRKIVSLWLSLIETNGYKKVKPADIFEAYKKISEEETISATEFTYEFRKFESSFTNTLNTVLKRNLNNR